MPVLPMEESQPDFSSLLVRANIRYCYNTERVLGIENISFTRPFLCSGISEQRREARIRFILQRTSLSTGLGGIII